MVKTRALMVIAPLMSLWVAYRKADPIAITLPTGVDGGRQPVSSSSTAAVQRARSNCQFFRSVAVAEQYSFIAVDFH